MATVKTYASCAMWHLPFLEVWGSQEFLLPPADSDLCWQDLATGWQCVYGVRQMCCCPAGRFRMRDEAGKARPGKRERP